ncbi:glutamate receptor ionotropic, delta-1 [Odontomachus brunneus]|uniref:glutamate receptor ionotropic, delta-1 n=1 Tax=Odontomachus brunneus TaxID=486640 RepID=UPI0013F1CD46|nr:glutamate receptor ionotropic, delta-1 [Odontomachus brunneus]XP_032687039.1 glutamate receptor ionotropic, delta-1 [Odontomachus brunneus]XP_032687040.1 glutamate receptor ionotropic, delta-1 [Odontomachus brunneus]XP_032687042.1 glutamate receptor ionotropic, delta-1 [Odontomachus brunneus]XP_032687043.1 glutamate receptor ionotropic, delta-1 [Odontomachus brunneus]XP_032687044.1 glutamate receptor ionotropic, delta-1 [Odontomachus brunneus]
MKANSIFVISLLVIGQILASKENIMTTARVKSWISPGNFTTIIQKSFRYSKCCNIYLSESIHSVEMLFNQFRETYRYDYLLRRMTYECQGYFLLGPTDKEIEKAMNIVPSSISTTEILIIVDGELRNDSIIFNVSLYGNANANIVSRSGIWTLSENYLEPRFFLKVNSYEELRNEFDMINMRGRKLQVCTFYRPPFCYLNTTIKKIINGVEEEVFPANNDKEKDGIEVKIFLILAEKLNFTWTLRKPGGKYRYGRRNGSEWNGGAIQLLRQKKVDMAFASIWLTKDHNAFVNMSEPWFQIFIHFLVPRPQPITSFWALTRPFSLEVWILLILVLLTNSAYMCTRARIDSKFPKRFRSFLSTITELMGRLLGTWVPLNTANARLELHLWQVVGVVLVTAYCSGLAARLTKWEYENRIDTVRQFLEANLSWGRKGQPPSYYDYFDMNDPYSKQLPSRYLHVSDDESTHRLIVKGKYAIIGNILDSIFFPEDPIISEDFKDYRVMKDMVGKFYSSFAVQPWLLRPVNTVILWLKETGITNFHLDDVIRRKANLNLREVLKEYDDHDGKARVLGLMPLGAGFITLAIGLLISTIVFFHELRQAAGTRPIREVFRELREKRAIYKTVSMRGKVPKRNRAREVQLERREMLNFHSIRESAQHRANVIIMNK